VGVLQGELTVQGDDALGGRKSAARLGKKVLRTGAFVEKSKTSAKQVKLLDKAARKLATFDKQLLALEAKDKIDAALAEDLLGISSEVALRIGGLRTLIE
jgi:hypothetical protein